MNVALLANLPLQAEICLVYRWSRVFRELEECKTDDDYRMWYIDDRAEPKTFYALLAFARPEVYKRLQNSYASKANIKRAVDFISDEYYSDDGCLNPKNAHLYPLPLPTSSEQ
jgi:hypothetical protein